MAPVIATGNGAEGSVVIFTVFEGTLAAMGIVVVVSAAEGAKGAREARGPGEAIEVGDAVEAGAVESIEHMEAGEVGGAVGEVKGVAIAAAGARNSNMATTSAAEIFAEIQI
jgi:hypothetical protein